jgi:hypothetical protein
LRGFAALGFFECVSQLQGADHVSAKVPLLRRCFLRFWLRSVPDRVRNQRQRSSQSFQFREQYSQVQTVAAMIIESGTIVFVGLLLLFIKLPRRAALRLLATPWRLT